MDIFNISALISALFNIFLSAFVAFFVILDKRKNQPLITSLSAFLLSIGLWSLGVFGLGISQNKEIAFIWIKLLNFSIICIPFFFLLTVVLALDFIKKDKYALILAFVFSSLFLILSPTSYFTKDLRLLDFGYFAVPGSIFPFWLLLFILLVLFGHYRIFQAGRAATGIKKYQIQYMFAATGVATAGGVYSWLGLAGYHVLPLWNITNILYGILFSLAIFKYHLADISLIIKKTTAYSLITSAITFTYVLVVLIFESIFRFIYGFYSFWASVPAAFVIAITFVPMREHFQSITDQIFFRRTIEYQNIIKEVTRLIVSVTDLNTLFRLIDRTIVRAMCVKNVAVLLFEERADHYLVEKTNGHPTDFLNLKLSPESALVLYLEEKADAVVLDEILSLLKSEITPTEEKKRLKDVCGQLQQLGAIVAIPSFTKDKLVGILCLGEKLSGEPYSPDDLELLLTMASEAGIAIENAKLYRDITETRDYLNSLVQGSDDAILTLDLNGLVLSWNAGAETVFGFRSVEIIGQPAPIFSPKEINQLIDKVLQGDNVKAIEIKKKNKKGKEIPLLLTLSPIRDSAGKIIAISAILKDITELRKVDRLKNEFLSIISHELRTPLTPIKGYLSLLMSGRMGKLEAKQKEALKIVFSQSNHLHDLIDSVIDISRIESGRPLELDKEPIFLEDVIRESIGAASQALKTKQISLATKFISPRTAIMADRKKLLRVIDNLLGNALKFNPESGTISISIERREKRSKVIVADTGIGLAAEDLEKIFKTFFQVDTSYTRASGGMGMGLAVAREIIEAHGGRIWAESAGLGKGSKFVFII